MRHRTPPEGLSKEEWWTAIRYAREQLARPLPLVDTDRRNFWYALPDTVLEMAHEIDRQASGRISAPEAVTNPETRDRYLISSLIEEAITSSQLEGASTTRGVAQDMIRSGRKPRDRSEQMIMNNYRVMGRIRSLGSSDLTPELVLELHEIVTVGTLDDPAAVGRFRRPDESVAVVDPSDGTVLHTPPDGAELPGRLQAMCDFANGAVTDDFLLPVLRPMIVHFWLAYDHPFVDGNGRTARALFYWSMLHEEYWLSEYLSISSVLKSAPTQYARAFLFSESDESDLTYFLIHHLKVVLRSIGALHEYLDRKIAEIKSTTELIRASDALNHRQAAVLGHALRHPGFRYTIKSHQHSHGVVYETARSDLLGLESMELLQKKKVRRAYVFVAPVDLADRLGKV